MVSASQSLAAQAGTRILMAGGNAIDAAVATAATLNLMEPMNVGIGGDLYAIIYIASQNKIYQLNAGDMAAGYASVDYYNSVGYSCDVAGGNCTNWAYGGGMPSTGFLSAPVPGAAWGWYEAHQHFGKLSLLEDLTPAIEYAKNGFPVTEIIGNGWTLPKAVGCKAVPNPTNPKASASESCTSQDPDSVATWYINGSKPAVGQIFKNPDLAKTLTLFGQQGRDVFYKGQIAQAIVNKMNSVAAEDGLSARWTMDDLRDYFGQWDTPAHTTYTNSSGVAYDIYETMAPSQAWNVVEYMNILQACVPQWTGGPSLAQLGPTNPEYWYYLVEAKKLAFVDLTDYNSDPRSWTPQQWQTFDKVTSPAYAAGLCSLVKPHAPFVPTPSFNCSAFPSNSPLIPYECPNPITMPADAGTSPSGYTGLGDTIYLTTADRWGNMVSWVNSNYSTFGSGITIPGYGFVINDRAAQFTLNPYSPNHIAPGKRPYNTISAGFVMQGGKPLMTLGLMGGDMQVQGHGQMLVNMLELGANPQASTDMARYYHNEVPNTLQMETQLYNLVGLGVQANGNVNPYGSLQTWGYTLASSGSNSLSSATGSTFGGYQSIMFTLDPTAPVPNFRNAFGNGWGNVGNGLLQLPPPVNGFYRAGTDHRKDGEAVGW
jgi:gamma-glutamyltranspeptidase/glutathione hydrolase